MMKHWRTFLIIAVLLLAAWWIYPTIQYYSMSPEAKAELSPEEKTHYNDTAMKLGLDLQGGMYLVLEIDDSKLDENAKKDALDRAIEIIRNRVDQFGVAEPVIQKQGDRRMIVQLPGLEDAERAKRIIEQTAQLEFRLVRDDEELARVIRDLNTRLRGVRIEGNEVIGAEMIQGFELTEFDEADAAAMDDDGVGDDDEGDMGDDDGDDVAGDDAAVDSLTTAATFDSLLPDVTGDAPIDLEVPVGEIDPNAVFSSYLTTAFGGAVVVDKRNETAIKLLLGTTEAQRALPRQSELIWSKETRELEGGGEAVLLYLVEKAPTLTGASLVDASTRPNPDDPANLNVTFTLDRRGALVFSRFTGENIGRRIAIVLDKQVQSAPTVQSKIPGGEGRITGQFTDEEANDLALVLRAGALPAPLQIEEERTIGPSLGRDSIVLGVRAAMYGFILVLAFMLIYYKGAGLLACVALLLNLVIVLAILAKLGAALTLPGIAGLILTIGMAVDANVLIFERIREELAKAKTVRSAIDSGYDRAFTTILDANVTTLITAFVLWQFGTGPIKGFATVLSIGIVVSMFTALLLTRSVFDLITSRVNLKKLSI